MKIERILLGIFILSGYNSRNERKKMEVNMTGARPIYKHLLIAAIALFVIGTAFALSDIYSKIGDIEHALICKTPGCLHGVKCAK